MIEAIIFDCDGTLVDSEPLGNEALIQSLAEEGIALPLRDVATRFRGRKLVESLAKIQAEYGRELPVDFVPKFRARLASLLREHLRPIDGALDMVKSIRQRSCVASNGPWEQTQLSLAVTGLLPFFEGSIFSSYEIGAWKPDPALFLHAAAAMGVHPRACAVVEDSPVGIQAGIAAGMKVFAYQPDTIDSDLPSTVSVVRHLSELKVLFA